MLRLALVGTGSWGKEYIKTVLDLRGCEIKYLCSPHMSDDHSIPNRYIKVDSYQNLFTFKDIDGVIIASPINTHYKIASEFLKKNINILLEKPPTASYKEALQLQEIAKQSKSILMIGHLYHYSEGFQFLKANTSKILSLQSNAGKCNPSSKKSALWEWGFHDIAMCIDLFKLDPIKVSAQAIYLDEQRIVDSQVFITLQFAKDIKAFIKLGWLFSDKTRDMSISTSNSLCILNDVKKEFRKVETSQKQFKKYFKNDNPLRSQLSYFADCINKKKIPYTDLKHSLLVMKILHLTEKSMKNNGKIYVIN